MKLESEKELEDFLVGNLVKDGKREYFEDILCGSWFDDEIRQLNLGSYGILDILRYEFDALENKITIQISELKKGILDNSALYQLCGYKKGVCRFFESNYPKLNVEVNGVLVGSSVDTKTEFMYLVDDLLWLEVFTYSLNLSDGIEFESQCDYRQTKETYSDQFNGIFLGCDEVLDRRVKDLKKYNLKAV